MLNGPASFESAAASFSSTSANEDCGWDDWDDLKEEEGSSLRFLGSGSGSVSGFGLRAHD